MTRFIMPIILIGIAFTFFFMVTNPLYNSMSTDRTQGASYSEALDNSKALESERDKLTVKYNAMDPDSLSRLEKLLPDNVNNIRLILEIGNIASPYGMVLSNVKYNITSPSTTANTGVSSAVVQGGGVVNQGPSDYGVFDLEFTTSGSYDNFLKFTKDLESNLRIVDISSVGFSSDTSASNSSKSNLPEIYKYDFKIKTYWLKN